MMIGEEEDIFLAIAMPQSTTPHIQKDFEEWEEMMREFGAEYIDFEMKGRNEFGGEFFFSGSFLTTVFLLWWGGNHLKVVSMGADA